MLLPASISSVTVLSPDSSQVTFKMIESVNLPSIHTNGQYNNNKTSDALINNNYRLKFPFHIKQVDAIVNQSLLKDFTGIEILFACFFFLHIDK